MPKIKQLDPYTDHTKALAAWMAAGMAVKELTQVDLAKLTGIPRTTISYRIRDPGSIKDREMWELRRVLGSPVEIADMIRAINQ